MVRYTIVLLAFFSSNLFGQTPDNNSNQYKLTTDKSSSLISTERSEYTNIYRFDNGKKVSAAADYPLNYLTSSGSWEPLTYELKQKSTDEIEFPAEKPVFSTTLSEASRLIRIGAESIKFSGSYVFFDENNQDSFVRQSATTQRNIQLDNTSLYIEGIAEYTDYELSFGAKYIKSNFIIHEKNENLTPNSNWVIEEKMLLPKGWSLRSKNGQLAESSSIIFDDVFVYNENGKNVAILARPAYTDNSANSNTSIELEGVARKAPLPTESDRNKAALSGAYRIFRNGNTYSIQLLVPTNWLLDNERVYPVNIDPVVIVENNDNLNTCFFPDYASDIISVNIPVGDTITNTFISWDFVATSASGAWTEDQRSYVSSVNGSTQLFIGTGNSAGTQTYSTSTNIGNSISGGSVDYAFFASRVWGGSGCNQTFNFIASRYIEVTHFEELTFGPGLIMVNEYSASNRTWLDAFNNLEDWIELYNTSSNFVDLTGYYLSDNINNPTKWQFPEVFIGPGERLVVICSGRDGVFGGIPHTNFRLSQLKPEHIIFSEPDGTILESFQLFVTQVDHSYGRTNDGGADWGIFTTPNPGNPNQNAAPNYTAKPVFSLAPGFYNNTVNVELSGNGPGEVIRYTLNGSEPTSTSTLYTGPIEVENTTVIRARCFDVSGTLLPGFIETNTYFINEEFTLPVFSFSGNQLPTLFNGTQIEPRGGVEFFDETGQLIDESYCDFDKHGNDSWQYPQRGVDFVSRDEFGYNSELSANFFSTKNRGDFQRLMVKAAANDNYPFEGGGAHIRDSYVQSLSQLTDLELDERSSTNCIVFVNGQYWGVYDVREKVDDKDFTEFYYDQERKYKGSEEYIQFIKTWGATQAKYGEAQALQDWATTRNFILNNNMGDPTNFAIADSLYDIKSMIDHIVINSFIVSRDWLNYNTGWWRGLDQSGDAKKWRYILWDTEAAFGHYINWTGLPDASVNAPVCQVENLTVGDGHIAILNKFINENPQVRQQYITRYADLMNTRFSCDNLIAVLDSMIAVIEPEMPRQIDRWGGTIQEWQNNVETLRQWILERCDVVVNSMLSCYNLTGPFDVTFEVYPEGAGNIKMNSEWLNSLPFEAFVYGNIETQLEALGIGQYQFSHWELNNHTVLPGVNDNLISLEVNQTDTIRAVFFDPNDTGNELLYYWHFNELNTSDEDVTAIPADYKLIPSSDPYMTYTGNGPRDIDEFQDGSSFNLHMLQNPGKGARVRNPSQNRALEFNMPTTGYHNLMFEYAVQRSGQGMLFHQISYSIDGDNFIQADLPQTIFEISQDYEMITIDFSDVPGVNNNPEFKIRITFNGNTTQSNGNNRFDNITLKGDLYPLNISSLNMAPEVLIFPNPFNSSFQIKTNFSFEYIQITDAAGRIIKHILVENALSYLVDLSELTRGFYFVTLGSGNHSLTRRVIKN